MPQARLQCHYEKAVYFLPLSFPDIPGAHLIHLGKDERLSRRWSHPVVLNTGGLDQESSALTTRPLLHKRNQAFGTKKHLVQNVPNASNFINLYFYGQNQYIVFITTFYPYPENFIPKYFILDDLLRKSQLLGFYPTQITAKIK